MSLMLTGHTILGIIDDEIQRLHENHDDGSVASMEIFLLIGRSGVLYKGGELAPLL
jgi:hypothetical protein